MKKIYQLSILGLILLGQASAKTVFFPSGPQKFEVPLPFSVHTFPNKNQGLPVQIAILGEESDSVYVFDGNKENTLKRLDILKVPAELSKKSMGVKEIQEGLLKNIFLQGTLPTVINFLPGEFKTVEKSEKPVTVSNGVIHLSKPKRIDRVTSKIFLRPETKWVLIKFDAKAEKPGFKGSPITLEPAHLHLSYMTRDINQAWSTQWMLIPTRTSLMNVNISNRDINGPIQIKNIRIYPL